MLYEFLAFIFCFCTILLILIVLMQKSHGGFWSGPASSDSTIIFGGSSGQDIFQKITWTLGVIFIVLGFSLSILKIKNARVSKFAIKKTENITEKKEDLNSKKFDLNSDADLNAISKEIIDLEKVDNLETENLQKKSSKNKKKNIKNNKSAVESNSKD